MPIKKKTEKREATRELKACDMSEEGGGTQEGVFQPIGPAKCVLVTSFLLFGQELLTSHAPKDLYFE